MIKCVVGGHMNKTHIDEGALQYLKDTFNIRTVLDIGCGPGGMSDVCKKLDIEWTGIDGDKEVLKFNKNIIIHNYQHKLVLNKVFDLAWSVEFVEHIPECYIDNFIDTFKLCKYVLLTAYPTKSTNKYHVNEQPPKYWIDIFNKNGFFHNLVTLTEIKKHSTMTKPFMRNNGLFFINKILVDTQPLFEHNIV